MIIKSIKYKNILSTGNSWTEIDFMSAKRILAVGANGCGKSTTSEALTFNLYGKSFRGIKKSSLVNSINKKGLLTESIVENNGSEYRIVRGVKPDIFEIYKDGVLEPSLTPKDQQKHLESTILKFPYKSFKQHVATGSGEYVQFMFLSAPDRRTFIENFLEIDVFSKMKSLNGDYITKQETELRDLRKDGELLKENRKTIQALLDEDKEKNENLLLEIEQKSQKLTDEIAALTNKREEVSSNLDSLLEKDEKYRKLQEQSFTYEAKISSIEDSTNRISTWMKNFDSICNCPTCLQEVDESHKNAIKKNKEEEISSLNMEKTPISETYSKIKKAMENRREILDKIRENQTILGKIDSAISGHNSIISHLISSKQKLLDEKPTVNLDIAAIDAKIEENNNNIAAMMDILSLYKTMSVMLKDDGVKSMIVKQYVTILNGLINGFLNKFNFFVEFEFDENFNETIKSRHRDVFTYENFSEGEKSRIDLSILFAFRQLAKMRSNLNCNLLIIDELLDSAMDANGISDLMSIFEIFSDENIYVISHRESATEFFDVTLKFSKSGHFSDMEIIR